MGHDGLPLSACWADEMGQTCPNPFSASRLASNGRARRSWGAGGPWRFDAAGTNVLDSTLTRSHVEGLTRKNQIKITRSESAQGKGINLEAPGEAVLMAG